MEERTVVVRPTYFSTAEPIKPSLKVIGCISDPAQEAKATRPSPKIRLWTKSQTKSPNTTSRPILEGLISVTLPVGHRLSDVIEPFWLGFWLDWQCLCGLKTRSRQCVIEQGQLGEEKGGFVLVQPIEMDWWSVVQSVAVKSLKRQLASYFLAMPRMGGFRKSDPVIFPPENDSGEIRNRFSFHSASWDE